MPEEEEELGTVKMPYHEDVAEPPEPFEWAPLGYGLPMMTARRRRRVRRRYLPIDQPSHPLRRWMSFRRPAPDPVTRRLVGYNAL
jgi:hypothetical protein